MIKELIGVNPRGKRVVIRRMSPATNQIDLSSPAKQFLEDCGLYNVRHRVADLEIWVRYEGGRAIKAGPTRESVIPKYKT